MTNKFELTKEQTFHFIKREADKARAKGETKFFVNIPCSRGHLAQRYVTGWTCMECARENYFNARDPEVRHRREKNREEKLRKEVVALTQKLERMTKPIGPQQ